MTDDRRRHTRGARTIYALAALALLLGIHPARAQGVLRELKAAAKKGR